jgi:S1-C subfamily serine protease
VKWFLKQIENAPMFNGVKVLRKPILGILYCETTDTVAQFLGNPQPGGAYVIAAIPGSPIALAGVKKGDMLYEVDGYTIDNFGEIKVPWSNDRISVMDYWARLTIGSSVPLIAYRNGKRVETQLPVKLTPLPPVHMHYPAYEKIDYEIIGGMVVMELMLNHVLLLIKTAPHLAKYLEEFEKQLEPTLIITNILPSSPASNTRVLLPGNRILEVNGKAVKTLAAFRAAIKNETSGFLTLRNEIGIFTVLPMETVLEKEPELARVYYYETTPFVAELVKVHEHGKKKA